EFASLPRFTDIVPQADDRLLTGVMLKAEHAHAGGAAEENPPRGPPPAAPAGPNHTVDGAPGQRQTDAPHPLYSGDDAVGPQSDVFGGFSASAAIPEEFPARPIFQDITRKCPVQAAVVPFDEVGIYLRDRSKTGQLACLGGALQGTGENADK